MALRVKRRRATPQRTRRPTGAPLPWFLSLSWEEPVERTILTRRTLLRTTLGTSALAAPSVRVVHAAGSDACGGGMVLAWHTNIAPRWLDPQQHDGGAAPDNFLSAVHEALIKNFREELYDHPALAERFEFGEDAKSASFRLRSGVKLHDGTPITPADKGTRARNSGKNG